MVTREKKLATNGRAKEAKLLFPTAPDGEEGIVREKGELCERDGSQSDL